MKKRNSFCLPRKVIEKKKKYEIFLEGNEEQNFTISHTNSHVTNEFNKSLNVNKQEYCWIFYSQMIG